MDNIKILIMGLPGPAQAVLRFHDSVELVSRLDDADYILQDAAGFRTTQYAPSEAAQNQLTRRELEVLRMTAEGLSVRQVASILCLSAKTVDAHKVNLMRKLKIHNKAHLVQYAFRNGIMMLEDMATASHC